MLPYFTETPLPSEEPPLLKMVPSADPCQPLTSPHSTFPAQFITLNFLQFLNHITLPSGHCMCFSVCPGTPFLSLLLDNSDTGFGHQLKYDFLQKAFPNYGRLHDRAFHGPLTPPLTEAPLYRYRSLHHMSFRYAVTSRSSGILSLIQHA